MNMWPIGSIRSRLCALVARAVAEDLDRRLVALESEARVRRARDAVRNSALLEQFRGIRRDVGEITAALARLTHRSEREERRTD